VTKQQLETVDDIIVTAAEKKLIPHIRMALQMLVEERQELLDALRGLVSIHLTSDERQAAIDAIERAES